MANELRRKPKQGVLTGVCAGLAEYLDINVGLVRFLFVIAALASNGFAIIIYFALAILLPVADTKSETVKHSAKENLQQVSSDLKENYTSGRAGNFLGIGLLVLGTWLLLAQILPEWTILQWRYLWPILLIVFGAIILLRKGGK